jgi:hypothetical protein
MILIPALMLAAAVAHLAPEHLARHVGGSMGAWAIVGYGIEALALWCAVTLWAYDQRGRFGAKASGAMASVAAWGIFESVQRASCRLAFDMGKPPPRVGEGKNLCDVAAGWDISDLSLIFAGWVAAVVWGTRAANKP